MKISHVTIRVKSLEDSLHFYRDALGLPVARTFTSGPSNIAFVGEGESLLELIQGASAPETPGEGVSIGYEVVSLEEIASKLNAAGAQVSAVTSPNPSVRFFFTKDPDGYNVQFVQNISPSHEERV